MDRQEEKVQVREDHWRALWAIGGAQFVDTAESHALSGSFPAIEQSLALNVGHLGIITSTRKIVRLIVRPLWSMAADRISRKAVLVWGTGVWGIWTLAVGFVADYQQLLFLSVFCTGCIFCILRLINNTLFNVTRFKKFATSR